MVQPYEFEEPREGGDRFSAEQAQNRRLIVVPIEYVPVIHIVQRNEDIDGIRINVVDLDADGEPAAYYGALWFGGNLIKAFKTKIGKMFLGYVNKELTKGGFKSWQFHSLTQDQQTVGMAQTFLAAHPEFMETCEGDVRFAETSAQQPQAPPQQGPARFDYNPDQGQWQSASVPVPVPPAPVPTLTPVPAPPAAPSTTTPPPAPGQQSVMERLKAQREAGQARVEADNRFENGPAPF